MGGFDFGGFGGEVVEVLRLEGGVVDFFGKDFDGGFGFGDAVFDGLEVGALFVRKGFRFFAIGFGVFGGLTRFLVGGELETFGGFAGFAFFEVVGVVAGLHHDAAIFEGHDLVADAVEEVAVVGDADDGAFEDGEGFLQHAEGGEVEVVGGLVEHDEVAAVFEDFGEHEAGAFASGEEVDALVDAVVAEEKALEVGAGGDGLVAEEELVVAV